MMPTQTNLFDKTWALNEGVLTVAFTGDNTTAAIALLDGTVVLIKGETEKRITVHPNGSPLSFVAEADGFLSGGDDGRVVRVTWDDAPEVLAAHKGKWIDNVAVHPLGLRAYSVGKEVYLLGREAPLPHPSSVGGIAFHPNGKRLAVSHYNGVSLWWLNAKDPKPQTLLWKGSHLKTLWHPSGDYLMTSMQENALHGWRMKDLGELRMAGYANKIHSFGFSSKGKWLATSGSEQIICWPFSGSGPQGKPPFGLGMPEEGYPCTVVAPNPKEEVLAAGYASGRIVLALFEDQLPIELLPPNRIPVVALEWSPNGKTFLAAREDGSVFLFTAQKIMAGT